MTNKCGHIHLGAITGLAKHVDGAYINDGVGVVIDPFGQLRRLVFGIGPGETQFARRGFWCGNDDHRRHLEKAGSTFALGYNAALEESHPDRLASRLDELELQWQGFAYEGAAMALALLDVLTPWKRDRWQTFLNGPGAHHTYMVHVGAGWAMGRLKRPLEKCLPRWDRVLKWLVVDGCGFHEGFFHTQRYVGQQETPSKLSSYARRVFDQGLGRSLWFVECADASRITNSVNRFAPARHRDLWSGVGLACTYAGGVGRDAIEFLAASSGPCRADLAQGAAFAAKARQRAGNPTEHADLACRILCRMSANEASDLTDRGLIDLPHDGPEPGFEVWRQRIRARCESNASSV